MKAENIVQKILPPVAKAKMYVSFFTRHRLNDHVSSQNDDGITNMARGETTASKSVESILPVAGDSQLPCGEIEAALEREAREELEAGKAAGLGRDAMMKYVEWAGDRYIMRPAQVDKLTFHIYFALQTALEMHREKKTPFLSRQIRLMCCLTTIIACGSNEKVCTEICKKYDL